MQALKSSSEVRPSVKSSLVGLHLPDLDQAVVSSRDHEGLGRVPAHAVHIARMRLNLAGQGEGGRRGRSVKAEEVVGGGRGEEAAARPREGENTTGRLGEGLEESGGSGRGVDPNGLVVAGRSQATVGGIGDLGRRVRMRM